MKILPSITLSLMFLGFWSCSDSGKPLGNDCSETLDCNSVCGGSAVEDACGTCGGSGLNADGCCGETSNCVHYKDEIQPIFNENCANCHISSTSNNLSLSNYASLMLGNSTNGPVIDAEDHANSLLWQYVNSGTMPPGNNNLTASQIDLIATWIDEGALEQPLDN